MSAAPRRIAIFGATSRIAIEAARLWLAHGVHLVLVARNAERLRMLKDDLSLRAGGLAEVDAVTADLGVLEGLPALWTSLWGRFSDLDAVLIAHGSLPDQGHCEADPQAMLHEVRVNALSAMTLLTAIANDFEARGSGTIGVIGSVAGDRGRRSNYVYGAAKGMLGLFLQGLRNRLYRKGVQVITLKPGFVITPMTQDFDRQGFLWTRPERVARDLVRAYRRHNDVVYLPWFWRPVMGVIRLIPERIFKRLSL
jgi:decaprenylphospho-beta-D-erythro-pentofuranosid-2-ulose 2-reductase